MSDEPDADEVENPTRESGVEFGDLDRKLEEHDYPTTSEEILAAYGEETLEMENGSETLREILGPLGEDGQIQEYESAEEVHQAIYNMVGAEAVGRRYYSDRGGQPMGDDPDEGTKQEESF
jgi:hypothetical protein